MRKLIRPHNPFDIQPDSLIFSDLHLHERKEFERVDEGTGLNTRLVEGIDILKQILVILDSHPEINNVFSLGDPFELKDKVPNHILIEYQLMLKEIGRGRKHWSLMGNHDFNIPKYPTSKLFDLDFITETSTIWLLPENCQVAPLSERVQITFIPFQRDFATFLELWKEVHNGDTKPNIVFFHQEVPGVTYETGREVPGIFPIHLFNPGTLYISGHIHKPQKVGQIQYVGSPYQIKFSDEGQERYIWLLNSKTREIASVKLRYPEFKSLDVRSFSEGSVEEVAVAGCYIRATGEVDASQWNPQIRKEIKESLLANGAKGVSINVQVSRAHQAQIPMDKVDDDESIIKLFVDENHTDEHKKSGMSKEELINIGCNLFKLN